MPRSVYHLIALIVALATIYSLFTHSFMLLSACLIWYGIGIYAANSHLNWCKDTRKVIERPWSFLLWYSLNGAVLLITTKMYEIWHSKTSDPLQ